MRPATPAAARTGLLIACLIASPAALALMAGTPPDSPAARILGAERTTEWSGAGEVITPAGRFGGVAVGAALVLTAAHVAAGFVDTPGQLRFAAGTGGANGAIPITRIAVMPGYRLPANDLALLTLARPLPGSVARYALLERPLQVGDLLEFVGAGRSGHGDTGVSGPSTPGLFRHGQNVVDLVGERIPGVALRGHYFLYDFDGPAGDGPTGRGTLGNGLETLVAGGDSGSPVFVRDATGAVRLAGINTVVIGAAEGRPPAFRFGDLGAGTDLTAAPVAAWLAHASDGAIRRGGNAKSRIGERIRVALAAIGALLIAAVTISHRQANPPRHA